MWMHRRLEVSYRRDPTKMREDVVEREEDREKSKREIASEKLHTDRPV